MKNRTMGNKKLANNKNNRVMEKKKSYDCSYEFEKYSTAKKYKYVVIMEGDLDLNGAIMIKNKTSLKAFLLENAKHSGRKILQIFEGEAIINNGE